MVQRPWLHHQSYDLDNKTAKWPWPPGDLDTKSHVTRTLYWSATCLQSLHMLGFACLPGNSCYLLGYCSYWGKDVYQKNTTFFWGGERHFNLHGTSFLSTWSIQLDASYTLQFVSEAVTCLYVLGIISPTTFWTHWYRVVRGDVLLFVLNVLTYRVQNASQLLFRCRV